MPAREPHPDAVAKRQELAAGVLDMLPVLIGTVPFGFVCGVAAVAAGMTPLEGVALSVISFSGIAQLFAAQLIATDSPVIVVVVAAFVVSLRFLMYSAALAPHLGHLTLRWRVALSYLMTDQNFASAMRHYGGGGERRLLHWRYLGSALTLYASWQAAVVAGVAAGAAVPEDWSLDFAVTLSFLALLVPTLRTRPDLAAAVVSAAVALAAAGLPYRLALVAASVAGIAAGMALELRKRERR